MGFVGVYSAIYDYEPRAENELELKEGDLLYVIEKSGDDDWWRAKRKAYSDADDEPEGLVPSNYVEEAHPVQQAKSLYDYTRQTDEEVSFPADVDLDVYDTSDPDWTLVRSGHDYGFAPANYIEIISGAHPGEEHHAAVPQEHYQQPEEDYGEEEYDHPHAPAQTGATPGSPAAALAGILQGQQQQAHPSYPAHDESADRHYDDRRQPAYAEEEPEFDPEDRPALPQRPMSMKAPPAPRRDRDVDDDYERPSRSRTLHPQEPAGVQPSPPIRDSSVRSSAFPSGYHLYNISESITVMGKKKKLPTTLGINVSQGMIFISRAKDDDRMEEWTADKLSHYSIEGKHVFIDLVRPSRSIDFHAGAKDTAQEIVALLGDIAGSYRAEGLKEVIAAGKGGGKKKGQVLYDFEAQGDDECTVAVGDEVIILDDKKSEEWWMVRRLVNGFEGVVPSSYIEITGFVSGPAANVSPPGLSLVEQSRMEEERLAREAIKKSQRKSHYDPAADVSRAGAEVGIGPKIPKRKSSLSFRVNSNQLSSQRSKKEPRAEAKSSKPKPDPAKTRKWTDRSGSFTVVAAFIGLIDDKIHLHKENGVKIAVPVSKMSVPDLEYVESVTGRSLDEDKPLSAVKRDSARAKAAAGAQVRNEPEYDWFDFFLKAGVPAQFCERYSQNFIRDSMDESVLPDITTENLRTLGLKEGDILRVMKYLDKQFNRTAGKAKAQNGDDEGEEGGLFSGPGGALRNNTRKSRPAPAVQTSDTVDPKVFETKGGNGSPAAKSPSPVPVQRGFDDDAWEVKKPAGSPAAASPQQTGPAKAEAPPAPPTGAMADLSLLQAPLKPAPAQPAAPAPAPAPAITAQPTAPAPAPAPAPAIQTTQAPPVSQPPLQAQPTITQPMMAQPTGANPSFFQQLGAPQQPQPQLPQTFAPQMTGYPAQAQPLQPQMTAMPSQPTMQAPQMTAAPSIMAPPRPLSAPQNMPQPVSAFGPSIPLQVQHTGAPYQSQSMMPQQQFRPAPPPPAPAFQPRSAFGNALVAQQTGMPPQQPQQFGMQPTGFQPQPTGFAPQPTGFQPQPTGYPALQPQQTGFGMPPPQIPPQPTATPLSPQKTGPPPPVRFGVKDAKKLQAQPTGLRANLAQATPANPFGF